MRGVRDVAAARASGVGGGGSGGHGNGSRATRGYLRGALRLLSSPPSSYSSVAFGSFRGAGLWQVYVPRKPAVVFVSGG
jgi:hypothetical protein